MRRPAARRSPLADDTTAVLLSFLAYELSKRPDLQKQIRAEVAEAIGSGPIDNLEALEPCKVLNACIKETLRRYPSAPFGAGRNMDQDFDFTYTGLDGNVKRIAFKKGDLVAPYLYGVQNFAPYWGKDPNVWSPERFLEAPSGDSVNLYAYGWYEERSEGKEGEAKQFEPPSPSFCPT